MSRNFRVLEINVISAESLHVSRRQPLKKNAFVVVRTDDSCVVGVTNADAKGGSYPAWNQKFVMEIPMYAKYFSLEVQCKSFSGDQVIGSARVPVSDFTGEYFPENYLHFLSYRLRDVKGEQNGIINLSVRVKSTENDHGVINYSKPWVPAPTTEGNVTHQGASKEGKVTHHRGVVMGVPVWQG